MTAFDRAWDLLKHGRGNEYQVYCPNCRSRWRKFRTRSQGPPNISRCGYCGYSPVRIINARLQPFYPEHFANRVWHKNAPYKHHPDPLGEAERLEEERRRQSEGEQ